MKLLGLLIVGFCIGFFGFIKTSRLISSQRQISALIELCDKIKEDISYSSMQLCDIFSREAKDERFKFLFNCEEFDTPKDYYRKICFDNDKLSLSHAEKTEVYDYLCNLGKTDLDGQIKHCDATKQKLIRRLRDKKSADSSKIKLYPSLFVLGGLMIIVVLI